MTTRFDKVPIGTRFLCNGNWCTKRTKRTAMLEQYQRIFYFRRGEIVKV